MSWGFGAGGGTAAAATTVPDGTTTATAPSSAVNATTSSTERAAAMLCFACSRCEYPICTAEDILLETAPHGTTDFAFTYDLECLLDLSENIAVPCYCCEETVDTAILVSERMIEEPLPPAARVMCMESVVESRKFLRAQQAATVARLTHQKEPMTSSNSSSGGGHDNTVNTGALRRSSSASAVHTPERRDAHATAEGTAVAAGSRAEAAAAAHEHDMRLAESIPERGEDDTAAAPATGAERATTDRNDSDTATTAPTAAVTVETTSAVAARRTQVPLHPVRRYGATTEARVDMIGIRHDVLGGGLAISSRDRSAAACPVEPRGSNDRHKKDSSPNGNSGDGGGSSGLPQEIIDAASQAPPPTAWGPPGNLTVEESFITVTRVTSSAQGRWFQGFLCVDRLECPDCHLPLGFLFERDPAAASGAHHGGRPRGAAGSLASAALANEKEGARQRSTVHGGDEEAEGERGDALGEQGENRHSSSDGARAHARATTAGSADVEMEATDAAGRDGSAEATTERIRRDPQLPPGNVPVFTSLAYERRMQQLRQEQAQEHRPPEGNTSEGVAPSPEQARRPRDDATTAAKRAKTENGGATSTAASAADGALGFAGMAEDGNSHGHSTAENFPDVFIGLELKRIKQVQWGLRAFQDRYARAQSLRSFRDMFPEAEELLSLYSRLSALRTQSELYNNLLRKHREQNDVQTSLIHSQKERLATYEEKLKTMQHIINAQRVQLEMQLTQIKRQEELMRSHRQQVSTQQQQIDVEQLLLTEQTKTIETQREQIRLMRAHLQTRTVEEAATVRDAEEAQQPMQDCVRPSARQEATTATTTAVARGERPAAPAAKVTAATIAEAIAERRARIEALRATSGRATADFAASATRISSSTAVATTATAASTTTNALPPAHLRGVHGTAQTAQATLSRHGQTTTDAAATDEEAEEKHNEEGASR